MYHAKEAALRSVRLVVREWGSLGLSPSRGKITVKS
jgi:hypothetical protein